MREATAIIAPAVDFEQNTRAILKEHIALQDDERNADAFERKSVGFREAAARRRVEIGRMLVEQKSTIKHGGWLPYLEKLGIEQRNAQRWMELAGYVDSKNDTRPDVSHLPNAPTLADAGIDKRPRKRDEQPDPVTDEDEDVRSEFVPVFKRVENTITKEAMLMFPKDRQLFAAWLRNVADEIDPTRVKKERQ